MKFFLDTADINEIKTGISWGIVDGVTTNPSLYAKVGGSYEELLKEICGLTKGPVSAEVISDDADGMVREGLAFAKIAANIVVKVPMTTDGLAAISRLKSEGIKTNCTLIFTANQGLLAAKAGASLISPFVGRLDDISEDGMTVIRRGEPIEIIVPPLPDKNLGMSLDSRMVPVETFETWKTQLRRAVVSMAVGAE